MRQIKVGNDYQRVLENIEKREEFLCLIVNLCGVDKPGDACGVVSASLSGESSDSMNSCTSEVELSPKSIVTNTVTSKLFAAGAVTLVAMGGLVYGLFRIIRKNK